VSGGCPDEELLAELADGALAAGAAAEVSAHLDGCDVCRETVAQLIRDRRASPALAETRPRAGGPAAPVQIGRFAIQGLLGRGGMGEVYRARDPHLGRDVAIKLLPPEMRSDSEWVARFEREARAIGLLSHPNILAVYDLGVHEGAPYVVTELLDGTPLRARLGRPLSVALAVGIGAEIAIGLAAAHEKGIVHRDIKPENIFVTGDGRVKILDFGLAKYEPSVEAGADVALATQPGVILGTAGYMAPEQVRGKPVDARMDIFSLGVVLHEMLDGRRPFRGGNDAEVMTALLRDPAPALPDDVPLAVARLVARCLAKDPLDRFQSARDLAADLRDALPSREQPRATGATARWSVRRALPAAAVALGVAAAVAATALATRALRPAPAPPRFERATFTRAPVPGAHFLPDGRSLVYSTLVPAGHRLQSSIFLARTDTTSAVPLEVDGLVIAASSSGQIAFLHDVDPPNLWNELHEGVLARMDATGGNRFDVADHVTSADFVRGGNELAVVRHVDRRYIVELAGHRIYESDLPVASLCAARTGDRLAFIEYQDGGLLSGRIFIAELARAARAVGGVRPLQGLGRACWTPDGRALIYAEGPTHTLHRLEPDGEDRPIVSAPDFIGLTDVAPDGRLLIRRLLNVRSLFGRSPAGVDRELGDDDSDVTSALSDDGRLISFMSRHYRASDYTMYVRPLDGGPSLSLGTGVDPQFSHDGALVAFEDDEHHEIRIIPASGGVARALPRSDLIPDSLGGFTPDGRQVVFLASAPPGPRRVYLQDVAGGPPRAIGPEGMIFLFSSCVSPDGRWASAWDADRRILLLPLDGGAPARVSGLRPGELTAGWTSDSRHIFAVNTPSTTYVDVVDIASGLREPLGPLSERLRDEFAYKVHVTPDGRAWTYTITRTVEDAFIVTP
jgi:eukaryotic-like serine/threonine-protein kinase